MTRDTSGINTRQYEKRKNKLQQLEQLKEECLLLNEEVSTLLALCAAQAEELKLLKKS